MPLEKFVRRAENIVLSATIRTRDVSEFTPPELIRAEDPMAFFKRRMAIAKSASSSGLRPEWLARQVLRAIMADTALKGGPPTDDGKVSTAIAHAKRTIAGRRVVNG